MKSIIDDHAAIAQAMKPEPAYDVIAADTQDRRMTTLWSVIASSPELLKAWNERDWPTVDRALKAMWTEIPIELKRP